MKLRLAVQLGSLVLLANIPLLLIVSGLRKHILTEVFVGAVGVASIVLLGRITWLDLIDLMAERRKNQLLTVEVIMLREILSQQGFVLTDIEQIDGEHPDGKTDP